MTPRRSDFSLFKKPAPRKIVMVSCYDAPSAALASESGTDVLLVGDSVGTVLLGYSSTRQVSMDEMLHHTRAVRRGAPRAFVVGDMPLKGRRTPRQTLRSARRFLGAGADAVKLEWMAGADRLTRLLVKAGIPVMGHSGLTPQTVRPGDRFRVRGRGEADALGIWKEAKLFEKNGAFALVLECVPAPLASAVARDLGIPVIGIGAGPACDGQVLVFHDILGLTPGFEPRFLKKYADLYPLERAAVAAFVREVRRGRFPGRRHSFGMDPKERAAFDAAVRRAATGASRPGLCMADLRHARRAATGASRPGLRMADLRHARRPPAGRAGAATGASRPGLRFRIGTRGSALAMKQAECVRRLLSRRHPLARFEIAVVKTRGDRLRGASVFDGKATGVFTREIEKKLLSGAIDIGVHSLKDLPTSLPRGLKVAACLKREDPRDCLVTRSGGPLSALKRGARVGTTSPRRARQLLSLRGDLRVVPLGGNLDTRVGRVLDGRLDAAVLARAGINRIGKYAAHVRNFSPRELLPCPGQGVLALEVRARDASSLRTARSLNDRRTEIEATAERELLKTLRGGCRVPIGAFARVTGGRLRLSAAVFSTAGGNALRAEAHGKAAGVRRIARAAARRLLRLGAGTLLDEARQG